MRGKKQLSKEEVLRQMMALATHPVNDAVLLAYLGEGQAQEIRRLDLTGLTEFKRNANGTVEIKLTDRMTVLEALMERLEEDRETGAAAFMKALEGTSAPNGPEPSRR